jgi:2-amino-4-hydroxy-6-hydroxymethyldihydropteridine diphosphokinase
VAAVTAYLCLGSNLGNRQDNLDKALALLSRQLRIKKISSVYETDPVGNVNQPLFLNLVCEVETRLSPAELLTVAKVIESKLGRAPNTSNAPRPIDIDILFYNEQVIETPELVIPHPRLTQREFVLVPFAEIAPNMMHPVNGRTIKDMLKQIRGKQGVFKWETT